MTARCSTHGGLLLTRVTRSKSVSDMSQQKPDTSPALGIQDILLILFKHKGKILFFSALGVAAAAAVYFLNVPLYESQAKLILRYVIDRSAIDPDMAENTGKIGDPINSEVQIFTSWDLADPGCRSPSGSTACYRAQTVR